MTSRVPRRGGEPDGAMPGTNAVASTVLDEGRARMRPRACRTRAPARYTSSAARSGWRSYVDERDRRCVRSTRSPGKRLEQVEVRHRRAGACQRPSGQRDRGAECQGVARGRRARARPDGLVRSRAAWRARLPSEIAQQHDAPVSLDRGAQPGGATRRPRPRSRLLQLLGARPVTRQQRGVHGVPAPRAPQRGPGRARRPCR